MNFRKHYGWNDSQVAEIEHLIRQTRDGARHIILGLVVKPARPDFFGEDSGEEDQYFIRVVNRVDLTPTVKAYSKPYKSRKRMMERYEALLHYWKLPCCCRKHDEELNPDLDAFLEDENEDFFGDIYEGFFEDDDEEDDPLAGFLEDDDEDEGDFFDY